jgi:hypothetical protein
MWGLHKHNSLFHIFMRTILHKCYITNIQRTPYLTQRLVEYSVCKHEKVETRICLKYWCSMKQKHQASATNIVNMAYHYIISVIFFNTDWRPLLFVMCSCHFFTGNAAIYSQSQFLHAHLSQSEILHAHLSQRQGLHTRLSHSEVLHTSLSHGEVLHTTLSHSEVLHITVTKWGLTHQFIT